MTNSCGSSLVGKVLPHSHLINEACSKQLSNDLDLRDDIRGEYGTNKAFYLKVIRRAEVGNKSGIRPGKIEFNDVTDLRA